MYKWTTHTIQAARGTIMPDAVRKIAISTSRRCLRFLVLALAFSVAGAMSATAADQVKVGKASATTFAFAPIEIGKEIGVWAKYNLDVESIGFGGDARLQQAMVADSIDFSLGSGPGMGFLSKGVPAVTVAAIANQPLAMRLSVGTDSPLQKYADIQRATVAVVT